MNGLKKRERERASNLATERGDVYAYVIVFLFARVRRLVCILSVALTRERAEPIRIASNKHKASCHPIEVMTELER